MIKGIVYDRPKGGRPLKRDLKAMDERTIAIANFFVSSKGSIREVARLLGVCKSTVHYELRVRLPLLDPALYQRVDTLLRLNKSSKRSQARMEKDYNAFLKEMEEHDELEEYNNWKYRKRG